jgi:hypothetical protein
MTRPDFLAALEAELQARGRPFSRADVLAFVEACWPLIEETPVIGYWASEFSTTVLSGTSDQHASPEV